jgi:hypothetical protein
MRVVRGYRRDGAGRSGSRILRERAARTEEQNASGGDDAGDSFQNDWWASDGRGRAANAAGQVIT